MLTVDDNRSGKAWVDACGNPPCRLDDRTGRAKLELEVKVATYYSTDPDKPTDLMMNDGRGGFYYRRDGEWVEAFWLMGKVWNGDAEWVPDDRAMEIMALLDRRHAENPLIEASD